LTATYEKIFPINLKVEKFGRGDNGRANDMASPSSSRPHLTFKSH